MKSGKFLTFNRGALNAALASALALAGTGFVSNAYAATGTANTTATVIVPISIATNTHLVFGKFSALTSGTFKVDANDTISATGGVIKGTGSTGTAAKFTVSGDTNNSFSITHANTVLTHTNTTTTMALATVSSLTAVSSSANLTTATLSSGTQTIFVGGTLTVATGQLAGAYAGTLTVAVEYN